MIEAADGAQALEVASAYADSIDLLLSDVLMPNVNGPALASRLLQQRPGTRVLFISEATLSKSCCWPKTLNSPYSGNLSPLTP